MPQGSRAQPEFRVSEHKIHIAKRDAIVVSLPIPKNQWQSVERGKEQRFGDIFLWLPELDPEAVEVVANGSECGWPSAVNHENVFAPIVNRYQTAHSSLAAACTTARVLLK